MTMQTLDAEIIFENEAERD